MGLRRIIKTAFRKTPLYFGTNAKLKIELDRITHYPTFKDGYTNLLGKPFKFHDGKNFVATYEEIFINKIYKFNPVLNKNTILDCGANMGLSVLYFALNYPQHKIIAFEPDGKIFNILNENVKSFGLQNVTLHNKAVWTEVSQLEFFSDGGMGGRIDNQYSDQSPFYVETIPLKDFLNEDVDFLKIDIEGAENEVLNHCAEELHHSGTIFFEYHNDVNKQQTLHELLEIVKKQGFNYYIKESFTREKPFIDHDLICESFDMALNVFCYKHV